MSGERSTVTISISSDPDFLKKIDERAASLHMTRTAYLLSLARKDLEAKGSIPGNLDASIRPTGSAVLETLVLSLNEKVEKLAAQAQETEEKLRVAEKGAKYNPARKTRKNRGGG